MKLLVLLIQTQLILAEDHSVTKAIIEIIKDTYMQTNECFLHRTLRRRRKRKKKDELVQGPYDLGKGLLSTLILAQGQC